MLSLLYTSISKLDGTLQGGLGDIVATAVRRNLTTGVTGALVYTGSHFAQVLEGSEPAVQSLMDRISVDPRHTDVRVLRTAYQDRRRFPNWGMTLVDTGPRAQALIDQAEKGNEDWVAEELIVAMERSASPVI